MNHHAPCSTVDEVISALGGDGAVRALTGRTQNFVSNWRADGRFPSNTYVVLTAALSEKGYGASKSLWRMI